MHRAGIYAIVHVLSGQRYFCQTNSFERRWHQHREALNSGLHHNPRLQAVWNADGELAFDFLELEVAPAYFQPVELQKWLLKRENELIRTYKAKGLSFNIVNAELVETRAALKEANTPKVSASSLIYKELQAVKFLVSAAETTVRAKVKMLRNAETLLQAAKSQQSKSIGLLRALFGRTDRPEDLENARQVEVAAATVTQAAADLTNCQRELEILLESRKELHNSYPGNVRRANARRRAWGRF